MRLSFRDNAVAEDTSVFIIAEVSANHGQCFETAVDMIKAAKDCGADAVKFQAYTPDSMTINAGNKYFQVDHPQWGGQSLYELYEKAYTPWEWFKDLKQTADDLGIVFLCTAFDKSRIVFCKSLMSVLISAIFGDCFLVWLQFI